MVAEMIRNIGVHMVTLDGMLHPVDVGDIRNSYAEVLVRNGEGGHGVGSAANAAARTVDNISGCSEYRDNGVVEYLEYLAGKFRSLADVAD